MQLSRTIVINCAGRGTRLGANLPKALVDIKGRPLIYYTLNALLTYIDHKKDEVRVVVGFESKQMIETVSKITKRITFVFNHNYAETDTLYSLWLASRQSKEYILTIDGDLAIPKEEVKKILGNSGSKQFLCYTKKNSDNYVGIRLDKQMNVVQFDKPGVRENEYEWTGIAQLEHKLVVNHHRHVYEAIKPLLPLPGFPIDCFEIDTIDDLNRAIQNFRY